MYQLVHIGVGAGKGSRLGHPGVHRNGGKGSARQIHIRLNFPAAESPDRELGLVVVFALLADELNSLFGTALLVPLPDPGSFPR